jgi:hypothetical protein
MKNRDFIVGGLSFHLNDNRRNEYEGKYKVLYNPRGNDWESALCTVDSKKEAVEEMTRRALAHDFPFDWFGYQSRF